MNKGPVRAVVLLVLILLLLGLLTVWPYSSGFGYYPSGGAGLLFVIMIVLIVLDVI